MRAFLKSSFEQILVRSGLAHLIGRGRAGHRLILAYHNIVPTGLAPGGDASLHLAQADFALQLDLLQELALVVPLETLLSAPPPRDRPSVSITFDDAYLGALQAGTSELARRGLPATMFVAPGFVPAGSFWWDAVGGNAPLTHERREHALRVCDGRDRAVREWARTEGIAIADPPSHARCGTLEDIRLALRYPGLLLGSHTWGHPALTHLDDTELAHEMTAPQAWLKQHFADRATPFITYPYGISDQRVATAARAAGYSAGFRVTGGWLPEAIPDQFGLPRLNIPARLSRHGFRLRVAGLFG